MPFGEKRVVVPARDAGAAAKAPFPAGMRVLAVDDDRTCLMMLEGLLRRCRYHVTTTNQAITALQMLRENKNRFDLVISDVHMPDMDGFKLLELVGLEMDLPVIMLSGNGETSTVMKGIAHGAVDYLLKPVRIEELKNIWQHVVRRKKFDSIRDRNNNFDGAADDMVTHKGVPPPEGGIDALKSGSFDGSAKVCRKRKDEAEGNEDDGNDNCHESEDPNSQKKPRVVWSLDLHHKFVAAINELGLEKAVPKRILDLMNVEGLTRENVASHLQKYRLYLRRLRAIENQQPNFVATFGGRDAAFLTMEQHNGFPNYHALAGSNQLHAFPPPQPSRVQCRQNYDSRFGFHGLAQPGIVKFGKLNDTSDLAVSGFGSVPCISLPVNQPRNLIQGAASSLTELVQSPRHKTMQEARNSSSGGFGYGLSTSDTGNCSINSTNKNPSLQSRHQFTSAGSICLPGNTSLSCSNPFEPSSQLPDFGRCSDTWQGVTTFENYSSMNLSAKLTSIAPPSQDSFLDDFALPSQYSFLDVPSSSFHVAPSVHGGNFLTTRGVCEDRRSSDSRSQHNLVQTWDGTKKDCIQLPDSPFSSHAVSGPQIHHHVPGSMSENLRSNGYCGKGPITYPLHQSHFFGGSKPDDGQLSVEEDYVSGTSKLRDGCSLDDFVNSIKPV